ncbi:MAG: hypothetical protein RI935_352 [Candidatus Parcubacteria bacterium]|jgi:hypothetical protein
MKIQEMRNSKKVRLWVIGGLIVLAGVLFFTAKTTWAKAVIGVILALLVGALGLEVANTDYDLDKMMETKSISESRVLRDNKGNIVQAGTKEAANAKYTDEYNCDDFKTQGDAQEFFDNAGGVSEDTNRLDGNKDGVACQSLPKGTR